MNIHVIRYPNKFVVQDRRFPTDDSLGMTISEHTSRDAAHRFAAKAEAEIKRQKADTSHDYRTMMGSLRASLSPTERLALIRHLWVGKPKFCPAGV